MTDIQSLKVQNIPENDDKVREVEDDEEEHHGQECVDLVLVVVRPGCVFVYQNQQSDVGEAQNHDWQNCSEK